MTKQVTETSADGLKREFTVHVPAADIDKAMSGRLQEMALKANLPGFRPGKVPVSLIRKRFGKNVRSEVLERTIQESWQQALEEKDIRPASEPKVEIISFEEGADLEYKLAVELLPVIEGIDFSTLKLTRKIVSASDDDVKKSLEKLAENRKEFEVTAGRSAQEGDQVVIDFKGTIDGNEFPGSSMDGIELVLGQKAFFPGFEEEIIGMKDGDTKIIKITMPDDFGNKELQGKEVTFDVTAHDVRVPKPSAVNDELAKASGFEDLKALKTGVSEQLEREYSQLSRAGLKKELLDKLAEQVNFELPESILEGEYNMIWKQIEEAKEKDTLDVDDKNKSEDELKNHYREIAERRVRLGLLLSDIGQNNNITVTQDDLNRAMHTEAARFPGQEAAVLEYFQKNDTAKQEIQAPIFEEKVVDFILEMADINDLEVSLEELMKPDNVEETN
ncbi:MAG: trigger factor [Rhodospirillaceae bacterium]|nr:trigger factor [Rhodospirillaceae bacterium]|tara:strand:- start:2063 stop:3400 length:1338 start_codon:yes stop_codon:yes gene_type:complete